MGAGAVLKARAAWLGRPWFFVAVAVLALNDHVFKGVWPGWVTGKLSDLAGLVVVATLAAVLLGPRWGTVVAGSAFVALKTVPGVAEAAAPFLGGGVTLRDASDLVALAVLPPLWWALHRDRADQSERARRGWIAVGLVAGVLATTATQPRPEDQIRYIVFHDGAFFAVLSTQSSAEEVLRSADGGRTWADAPKYRYSRKLDTTGADCTPGGTCYRIARSDDGGCSIERGREGAWKSEGPVPQGCPERLSIAANDDDARSAVTTAGPEGVAYRDSAGHWTYVDLMEIARGPKSRQDFMNALGGSGVTLSLTALLSILIGFGVRPAGLAVVLIISGWLTVPPVLLYGGFNHWKDNAGWNAGLVVASLLMLAVAITRVLVRRKRGHRGGLGGPPERHPTSTPSASG